MNTSRSKPVSVTVEHTRQSGVVHGPVRVVHPAIRLVGSPGEYDGLQHAYRVPGDMLDDVTAAIEAAGHTVHPQSDARKKRTGRRSR